MKKKVPRELISVVIFLPPDGRMEWNGKEDEEEEINTYHRVYAINNEAGPPLIRPLPILTNNLEERKKKSH